MEEEIFKAFIDAKMLAPNADRYKVIEEFCAHMISVLKEWYCSLGPIRQDELHIIDNTDTIIAALHHEFLRDLSLVEKEIKKEYFDMKCCSLKKPNLKCHFKRMAQRFYRLNGYNDPSLKNTYVVNSLLKELQAEMYRMIIVIQRDIVCMTLREIHQTCLATLCSQKFFLKIFSKIEKKILIKARRIILK